METWIPRQMRVEAERDKRKKDVSHMSYLTASSRLHLVRERNWIIDCLIECIIILYKMMSELSRAGYFLLIIYKHEESVHSFAHHTRLIRTACSSRSAHCQP
jgi:hypothetical protein